MAEERQDLDRQYGHALEGSMPLLKHLVHTSTHFGPACKSEQRGERKNNE